MAEEQIEDLEKDKPSETSTDKIPLVEGDKHLDQLIENMPAVVPDAVAAATEKEKAVEVTQSTAVDNKGRAFDPSLHATDSAGNPIRTMTGRFKRKLKLPNEQKAAGVNIPAEVTAAPVDMRIKTAAAKYADLFIITGISFFGEEWKPEMAKGVDERAMLVDANERAMMQYGYVEPPAWIDLLMVYSLYMGKRCFQPVTKSRIKIIFERSKVFFTNIWLKVTGQKIKIVPTDK